MPSGVQQYVKKRGPQQAALEPQDARMAALRRQQAAELKVPVPSRSTTRYLSQAGPRQRPRPDNMPSPGASLYTPKIMRGTAISHRGDIDDTHKDRYDTDAESIGDTTATLSEVQVEDSQTRVPGGDHGNDEEHDLYVSSLHLGAAESESESGVEENKDADPTGSLAFPDVLTAQDYEDLTRIQTESLRGFPVSQDLLLTGAGQSYPTTTSGRPEFDDVESQDELSDRGGPKVSPSHPRHFDHGQARQGTRLSLIQPQAYRSPPRHTGHSAQLQFSVESTLQQNLPRSASAPEMRQESRLHSQEAVQLINSPTTHQPAFRDPERSAGHGTNLLVPRAAVSLGHGSVYQLPTDEADHRTQQSNVPYSQEPDVPSIIVELDYEPPALFEMDYAALKNESFDHDPNAPLSVLPEAHTKASLPYKLGLVASMPEEAQQRFFASLTITEWEDSGDWFLGRFGALLQEIKQARQTKRQMERRLEAEIEERYAAVSRKRRITVDALVGMKITGDAVLHGTPKEKKKKTQAL
ncbi:hypothetical protein B0A49_11966 [Cryomyces minteri]|uniref:Extracellular mutant protein 11 C-terminal domain-containing protein n=1 Tax=Cryomyces minteri TaxID=331657 RepID=A0A4U0W6L4_9PEZI|nr:hypothetical protein B0A49_11966 [Cryomyces minteri]